MPKPSLLKQEILPETVGNYTYSQFSGYTVFNRVYLFSEITYFCIYTSVNDTVNLGGWKSHFLV